MSRSRSDRRKKLGGGGGWRSAVLLSLLAVPSFAACGPPSVASSLAEAADLAASENASADGQFSMRAAWLSLPGDDPVQRLIADEPSRHWVIFWPAAGECTPHELEAIDALERFQGQFPDARVVSVLSEVAETDGLRYGRSLQGSVVRLSPAEYERQRSVSPLPRLEVWTGAGELVLLKSLPPSRLRSEDLLTELSDSRSFTRPLDQSTGAAAP